MNKRLCYPGDLVLVVRDGCIRLQAARMLVEELTPVREFRVFVDVLSPEAYDRGDVQDWLEEALKAAGGSVNVSGIYPLVVPVPEWLEAEMVMMVLRR